MSINPAVISAPVCIPPQVDVASPPKAEIEKIGELKIKKKEQAPSTSTPTTPAPSEKPEKTEKAEAIAPSFAIPPGYDEEAAFTAAVEASLKTLPVKRLTPSTEPWMTTQISYLAKMIIGGKMPAAIEATLISHKEQITPEAREKIKKLDAYAMNTVGDVEKQGIDVLESLKISQEAKEHSHKDLLRILKIYAENGIWAVKAEFAKG